MKLLKAKFVGLMLMLAFVISIFSGVCLQNMNMDEEMAMAHSGVTQEQTAMDHFSTACEKACEVSTYEISHTDSFVVQDTSIKFLPEFNEARLIVENIFVLHWSPPPIQVKNHTTGGYQEGIKLLL